MSSTSIDLKLELLNEKCDKMITLFENLLNKKKKKEPVNSDKTEYSIKEQDTVFLIKFEYNIEFKKLIKELGGIWLIGKRSWLFPLNLKEEIILKIAEKFPKWTIV